MAVNQIEFLRSGSVNITNGTKDITVTGSIDCSGVYSGTAVFINNEQVVEAVSGTGFNPATGEATITLRYNWDKPTVTSGTLVAFNSIEGLNSAVTRLNEVINSIPDFVGATGQGLLYNDGNNNYSIKTITTQGESIIAAVDPSAVNAILGNPDFSSISGFAGVLKKDALDNYSLISSTAFGESLLTQADASSARFTLGITDPSIYGQSLITQVDAQSARAYLGITDPSSFGQSLITQLDAASARVTLEITDPSAFGQSLITQADAASARAELGITDPSTFGETLITQADALSARATLGVVSATEAAEGLIRKQTQAEALAGTDDSGSMSALRVHQSFKQYGIGADTITPLTQDLNLGKSTGYYVALSPSTNKPTGGAAEGFWKTFQYDSVNYSLQEWTDFGSNQPRKFFRTEGSGVYTPWFEVHTTASMVYAQNLSGATIASNATVAGSSLSPSQLGSWVNVCGNDINNNGYGLFQRV